MRKEKSWKWWNCRKHSVHAKIVFISKERTSSARVYMWPLGCVAVWLCDIFCESVAKPKPHIQINPCQRGYSNKMCVQKKKKKNAWKYPRPRHGISIIEICQWQCTLFRSTKTLFGLGCRRVCVFVSMKQWMSMWLLFRHFKQKLHFLLWPREK